MKPMGASTPAKYGMMAKGLVWEVTKFVGVIAWIVGLVTMNLIVLAVALFITVASITHTRRVRHEELLEAVKKG